MLNVISQINSWGWEECSILKFKIEYDNISVEVINGENNIISIICEEFIGLEFIGNWDECFIEEIKVKDQGKLIEKSIEKIMNIYGDNSYIPGMKKNIKDKWYQLSIILIDGVIIDVACKNIKLIINKD